MPQTPEKSELYWDPYADGGENPTPQALSNLLVSAVREQKVVGKPHIVFLSQEGAKKIKRAGIEVNKATQAVTNITGVAVGIRKR